MRFAKYWARESAGKWSCWRWSDESEDDARNLARGAAQSLEARMMIHHGETPDRYPYGNGDRPMREEVLEEFRGADGGLDAAITRNGYGCRVLNAARLMFVDIDLIEPSVHRRPSGGGGIFGWLFGGGREEPAPAPAAAPQPHPGEAEKIESLRNWLRNHAGTGARVYRTAAGLRYLMTHAPIAPDGDAISTLEQLGSDPLYIQLCKAQQCFRARLGPKPWRIGEYAIHNSWPNRSVPADWLRDYGKKSEGFATCALIEHLENPKIDPRLEALVSRHDAECRATSGLPLA